MKNAKLDALTEKVEQTLASLPDVYMHGSGDFIDASSKEPVPPAHILRSLFETKQNLESIYDELATEPRHASPKRGGKEE